MKIRKLTVSVSVCRIFEIAGTEALANKKAEPRGYHERIHVRGGFCRDKSERDQNRLVYQGKLKNRSFTGVLAW